jgi:hypothetical protein
VQLLGKEWESACRLRLAYQFQKPAAEPVIIVS